MSGREVVTYQTIDNLPVGETSTGGTKFSKDIKLNQILADFELKLNVLGRDTFTVSDLVRVVHSQPADFLREQFSKVRSLVGAREDHPTLRATNWFFDEPAALCARAALEFYYQGYNQNEIGLMLKKFLTHPQLNAKVQLSAKEKVISSPARLLLRARGRRNTLRAKKIVLDLLPIGHFDPKYARFVALYTRENDQNWVDKDKEEEVSGEKFNKPPVSSQELASLAEPSPEQVKEAMGIVARWSPMDTLSFQKVVNELTQVGIDSEQVRPIVMSVIYVYEFLERGKREVDFDNYTHSFLRVVLRWWYGLKEKQLNGTAGVKLHTLVAEIERQLKAEEMGF